MLTKAPRKEVEEEKESRKRRNKSRERTAVEVGAPFASMKLLN
jgi:hypothetical protein